MSETADTIKLATELTVAWLANPNTRAGVDDVPVLLATVHQALGKLSEPAAAAPVAPEHIPAVSVRQSLADKTRIISMIDGKPYASLKRHLAANGLSPDEYRARFRLRRDYPMVAPGYSAMRREAAKARGLGRTAAADEQPASAGKGDAKASSTPATQRKRLGIAGAKAAARQHLEGAADS